MHFFTDWQKIDTILLVKKQKIKTIKGFTQSPTISQFGGNKAGGGFREEKVSSKKEILHKQAQAGPRTQHKG